MVCDRCKGKGYIYQETPVTLNWLVRIIGFFFGPFTGEVGEYEKRPGKVRSPVTCSKCNGTGEK